VKNLLEEDLDSFGQEGLRLPISVASSKIAEFEMHGALEMDWMEKYQIIQDFDPSDPNRIRRGPVPLQQKQMILSVQIVQRMIQHLVGMNPKLAIGLIQIVGL